MKVKGLKDTIKWYDNNATFYSNAAEDLGFPFAVEKFLNYLPKGSKILDAGCGSGRDSGIIKSKGFNVIGVDISKGLLEVAKKNYPDIPFVYGDLLKLPFSKNNFDGICSQASLVHLETIADFNKALSEFHRVLKKDGIIHIFVKEQTNINKTEVIKDKISNHDRFFQYYRKDELIKALNTEGFDILYVENNIKDPAGRKQTKWLWSIARKI